LDAGVLPVIGAIAATTTPAAAAELLGIAKPEFRGLHSRLQELRSLAAALNALQLGPPDFDE
jgi:hypothetical protein